jgi:hypothetical protein
VRLLIFLGFSAAALLAQSCPTVTATPSADYTFLIGSAASAAPSGSHYRWLVNGQPVDSGRMPQLFLLHADGGLVSSEGIAPLTNKGVSFSPGRWGSALTVASGGALSYPTQGSLGFNEGSVEMWIAPLADASDPAYSAREHTLFYYQAPNHDYLKIAQSNSGGILYAGGSTNGGQWESAYSSAASMSGWHAGEWHHIAFTFSASGNFMRFYLDGVLTADTNEKHYLPPDSGGDRFYLGQTPGGTPAAYLIDEVRISSRAMTAAEVSANATRQDQPRNDEVWLPLAQFSPGDRLVFQLASCTAPAFAYLGIPVTQPKPASTLLAPGTTQLQLSVQSAQAASCGYAIGSPAALASMTPFSGGQGSAAHQTLVTGLSPDPTQVNDVYIRCDNAPDFALHLLYRALPVVSPHFPRVGNLWGSANEVAAGMDHASKLDLYLGATFTTSQIRALRAKNPNILILNSINTVENSGVPEDYYLHDIHGKRIEVWPGTYRLNLTKSYVAEYQAQFAYQKLVDSGMLLDGCFFDNFFTTESWLKADIWGNPVQIDANEDGVPDDPAWLDAAWHDGVYHELNTFRELMPNAFASGHLPRPPQTEFSTIFNGDSIGFLSPETADGTVPFSQFWAAYQPWWTIGRAPVITMVESAPPFQIGYGYGYSPQNTIPASTLEFARTYYPYMRFGLTFALMNDGYFAHEFGDTWHGNNWWYDELDFDLGLPSGPAQQVSVAGVSNVNLLTNGGFEAPLSASPATGSWLLEVTKGGGAAATVTEDASTHTEGAQSVRLTVTGVDGTNWHVGFEQQNRSLQQGISYDLTFWAKADVARPIAVDSQKNGPTYPNYGLSQTLNIGTAWQQYTATFQANTTANDARIQFWVGQQTGQVWLDDVRLVQHPPDVWRRDFTNGIALLNGSRQSQTVTVGPGFHRLTGSQAPLHEYIVDDASSQFTTTGSWRAVTYDSGMWMATGPYFHNWGSGCHELDSAAGTAQWDLALRADDTYTIDAWWAAAPTANTWSSQVVFEVVAGGQVVASTTVDQTTGGDQWHTIATVPLAVKDAPFVRIRNAGTGAVIADALHVRSASRYNDGSAASTVTLEPMDGIILGRNN